MLLALLFKHLHKYSKFPFKITYLVMDPGYKEENINLIKENIQKMEIPARIVKTDIFEIISKSEKSPCYLCARMRRGVLYRLAKGYGCNKIALGHHYDDVIETTLMNMLNSGSFQTMLPKLHSDHFQGMELIRPLYLVREESILNWVKQNNLRFIRCACPLTENNDQDSQRANTKQLIKRLKEEYSPFVEKNIFKAAENVNVDMVLGYRLNGIDHHYLEDYENKCKELDEYIIKEGIEEKEENKAKKEHRKLIEDDTFLFLYEKKGKNV